MTLSLNKHNVHTIIEIICTRGDIVNCIMPDPSGNENFTKQEDNLIV